jgi:DNA replication protein DnaC
MEIVADRYDSGAKMITSRLPVEKWCDLTANPTRADAILDRIVHLAGVVIRPSSRNWVLEVPSCREPTAPVSPTLR